MKRTATDFQHIRFKGRFRSYQQKVLDEVEQLMDDGKLHVVASPGSGKTILGLEIICRLGEPALILSPSVTIRQQWGQRFEDQFLTEEQQEGGAFMSYSLKSPSLLTSVTYQALHAAWTKQTDTGREDGEEDGEPCNCETAESYEEFDIVATIRQAGVKTICLDEAHHLRSEWQKALEAFLSAVKGDVKIVSLTATPPYDCTPAEWNRYMGVCGEIDEEIFVPELVSQQTLCPHQDYIMFNYPGAKEQEIIREHRIKSQQALRRILQEGLFGELLQAGGISENSRLEKERLFEWEDGYTALFGLARSMGMKIPKRIVRLLTGKRSLPSFSLELAEKAFQFIMDHADLFSADPAERLKQELKRGGLLQKGKVQIKSNAQLSRLLVSSTGKLASIARIADEEWNAMGNSLRMLVLTDWIRKDMLPVVGTSEPVTQMGTVPVFETIRRAMGPEAGICLLSGSLVLCPDRIMEGIALIASQLGIACSSTPLGDTGYSRCHFGNSNKNKVAVITEAFRQGLFHILVGTKSLLGEGWDSPCINSLILASFVGSFVLGNQMRGRAIRTDPGQPGKTANIWHLATIEPPWVTSENMASQLFSSLFNDTGMLISSDFDMLRRRFECFMGPAYGDHIITNGIERIDIITPPFTPAHIDAINNRMLALAANRNGMAAQWASALNREAHPEVILGDELPSSIIPTRFSFIYLTNLLLAIVLQYALSKGIVFGMARASHDPIPFFAAVATSIVLWIAMARWLSKIFRLASPVNTIKALGKSVFDTMRGMGIISSPDAMFTIKPDETGTLIECYIKGASLREKNLFADAMKDLLSPIDNPRYVMVRSDMLLAWPFLNYRYSFACPSIIGVKKENVVDFEGHLKRHSLSYRLFYTRNEEGRPKLFKSRRNSFINRSERILKRIMRWG